jgi:phosphoribosylanthranilate isomerase
MTVRIKICGMNDAAAIDAAIEAGVDWVGFVFFPPSPRFVTPAQAAALSARHPGGAGRVGLFVEPEPEAIEAALAALKLDALQLYTSAGRAAEIRARFGVPVWRAIGVSGAADLPRAAEGADAFLLEAKPPRMRRARAATRADSTGQRCAAGPRRCRGCSRAAWIPTTWPRRSRRPGHRRSTYPRALKVRRAARTRR